MENKNWSQIGDEIREVVESAVDSMDFGKLNQSLSKTVDEAFQNVNRTFRNSVKESAFRPGYEVRSKKDNPLRERFRNTGALSGTGVLLSVLGYLLCAVFGITILSVIAGLGVFGHLGKAIVVSVILAPFFLGSAFLAYRGSSILSRLKRFRKYMRILGEREFCPVSELTEGVDRSQKFVLKDLKRMIRERYFLQGHLDRQGTCLMVTEQVYQQYQEAEKQLQQRIAEQEKAEKRSWEYREQTAEIPEETRKVIEMGWGYLKEIRESNDRIEGLEVSGKIERLELVVEKILNRVEQHPELTDDLGKFMDYYLPTTVKLLKAYEELEEQEIQGENISASRKEIEKTLDTIHLAFENLLDRFFEKAAWDISSDISVLQHMFAQEGLTGSDFERKTL